MVRVMARVRVRVRSLFRVRVRVSVMAIIVVEGPSYSGPESQLTIYGPVYQLPTP